MRSERPGLDPLSAGLLGVGYLLLLIGFYYAMKAPPDVDQGYLVRILYVHVAAAWTGYLAFIVAGIYALLYLIRGNPAYDRLSAASAEIGLWLSILMVIGGMMWARPTWGVYWVWEPRLTSVAVMIAIYVGYFLVRQAIEDPEMRAKAAAAVAILGVINIPITYMSVYWWRSIHQTATIDVINRKTHMPPEMLIPLLVNLVAFSVLYVAFLRIKGRIAMLEARAEERHG